MRCSNTQGHMYHVYSNYTGSSPVSCAPPLLSCSSLSRIVFKRLRKNKNFSHVKVRRGGNKDGRSTLQEQFLKLKNEPPLLLSTCAPCRISHCIICSSSALKTPALLASIMECSLIILLHYSLWFVVLLSQHWGPDAPPRSRFQKLLQAVSRSAES